MSVPISESAQPTGGAYTGTLERKIGPDGHATYYGPIRALDSATLRRDAALEATGAIRPSYLELSQVSSSGPRQRIARYEATIRLASGTFTVLARDCCIATGPRRQGPLRVIFPRHHRA